MNRQELENMYKLTLSKYIGKVNIDSTYNNVIDVIMRLKFYTFMYCYTCGVLYTCVHEVVSWERNNSDLKNLIRCCYDQSYLNTLDLPFEIISVLASKHKVIHNESVYSQKISIEELTELVFELKL